MYFEAECLVISASLKTATFCPDSLSLPVLYTVDAPNSPNPPTSPGPILSLHRIHNYPLTHKIITDSNYRADVKAAVE